MSEISKPVEKGWMTERMTAVPAWERFPEIIALIIGRRYDMKLNEKRTLLTTTPQVMRNKRREIAPSLLRPPRVMFL